MHVELMSRQIVSYIKFHIGKLFYSIFYLGLTFETSDRAMYRTQNVYPNE